MGKQGKKTDTRFKKVFLKTLLSELDLGKRERDVSTPKIVKKVLASHPDWSDEFPEHQTINRWTELKKLREIYKNPMNTEDLPWSLGYWKKEKNGIDKDNLETILFVMTYISGWLSHEITIREAKWLDIIIKALGPDYINYGTWYYEANDIKTIAESKQTKKQANADFLFKKAQDYSFKERILELLDDSFHFTTVNYDASLAYKDLCSWENRAQYEFDMYVGTIPDNPHNPESTEIDPYDLMKPPTDHSEFIHFRLRPIDFLLIRCLYPSRPQEKMTQTSMLHPMDIKDYKKALDEFFDLINTKWIEKHGKSKRNLFRICLHTTNEIMLILKHAGSLQTKISGNDSIPDFYSNYFPLTTSILKSAKNILGNFPEIDPYIEGVMHIVHREQVKRNKVRNLMLEISKHLENDIPELKTLAPKIAEPNIAIGNPLDGGTTYHI